MSETSIRAAFAMQAQGCRALGAPFTGMVCEQLGVVLDRSSAMGRAVLDWPGDPMADQLMLRVAGGLNALVRAGALPALAALYPPAAEPAPAVLAAALAAALHDDRLLPWLSSAPQTNEVARSAALMAGLLVVAGETGLPLRLFELGPSAGLNMNLDRYRYDLGGRHFGPADAPLRLAPRWAGASPPDAQVHVVERHGVDLNPLDAAEPATQARLMAYVWPEQRDRVVRLEAALAIAAAHPPQIDRDDAAAWVEARVAPQSDVASVVLHSIAFQYFPATTQARIAAHLENMGARATPDSPLAWLRFEMDDPAAPAVPTLRLRLWPGGGDRLLAHAHPHGASIRWEAA